MIIAYYGDGKGKTTAALGIALRALGRGKRVAILQFIKGDPEENKGGVVIGSGEQMLNQELKVKADQLFIKALGQGFYRIEGDRLPDRQHQEAAQKAVGLVNKTISDGKYDIIILDEVIRALSEELVTEGEMFEFINKARTHQVHLVLTGHEISQDLIEKCDLVTEMKKIKHPYDKGILAQEAIDY